MVDQTASKPTTRPARGIVATGVSAEDYLEHYAAKRHEWVTGVVSKMAPVSLRHTALVGYLWKLLDAYFALNPIGTVAVQPFVMRLEITDSYREPDLQVILNTNPGELTDTAMIGPADICIEVVSPESVPRDHGEKFEEYEKGGVGEYWIIDPLREECRFYRLQSSKLYAAVHPDEAGNYRTPQLPHLALHVPTLWREELPNILAIVQTVRAMVEG